jgi:hypothetical protein
MIMDHTEHARLAVAWIASIEDDHSAGHRLRALSNNPDGITTSLSWADGRLRAKGAIFLGGNPQKGGTSLATERTHENTALPCRLEFDGDSAVYRGLVLFGGRGHTRWFFLRRRDPRQRGWFWFGRCHGWRQRGELLEQRRTRRGRWVVILECLGVGFRRI